MDKEYLIKKWLADELTDIEWKAFKKLDDYDTHIKILEGAKRFKADDSVNTDNLDAFYKKYSNRDIADTTIKWYKPLLKIAAMAVLLAGIASFFFFNTNRDILINTTIGEKTTIMLPDDSSVTINSKSEVVYSNDNWDSKREIFLEGEGFFKVAKGATFDVIAQEGSVQVLGTEFNVKSRDDYFEVQCFEGLVLVKYKQHTEKLSKGRIFRAVDGMVILEEQEGINPGWIHNISSFKSVPFYQVIDEFERQYNVTFFTDNIETKRVFTGGFTHRNIDNALKSITLPLDLKYKIDSGNNIILSKK